MSDSDGTLSRTIAFFVTSSLGKLPFVYFVMLLWSGVVMGFTGQAFMFFIYSTVMLVAYGLVRPVFAQMTSPDTMKFMYSLTSGLTNIPGNIDKYLATYMGLPISTIESITRPATSGVEKYSWLQKYLLAGIPDAMIFPSAFLYGYGAIGAENGITDSKNMPMLFTTLLSLLLQLNISQMSVIAGFLNVVIGLFLGVLMGSFVSDNPDLGPFGVNNQQFKVVVTNPM